MTHADRAAALRALEQRALAEGHPMLAIVLCGYADSLSMWRDGSPGEQIEEARAAWMAEGTATMREHAAAQRTAERHARVRAELAEAALAVLDAP